MKMKYLLTGTTKMGNVKQTYLMEVICHNDRVLTSKQETGRNIFQPRGWSGMSSRQWTPLKEKNLFFVTHWHHIPTY